MKLLSDALTGVPMAEPFRPCYCAALVRRGETQMRENSPFNS
jgi:hypothetical protein